MYNSGGVLNTGEGTAVVSLQLENYFNDIINYDTSIKIKLKIN